MAESLTQLSTPMKKLCLHLIANSHLDPVWLWDWREGLNEGITTVRTLLQLMDERPELTYIRGESAIYEQVLQHDPESFAKICAYVREGRWDVVGGSYLQPDMNLPATETLLRHFIYGQNFFRKYFGKTVKVGWSADCFGHSAGLPDILHAAGLSYYVYGRPVSPDREKLFWWEGPSGARVLAATYLQGWYGCERGEISSRLDAYVKAAPTMRVKNILVPFGLGNHGGGPTRRQLDDVIRWKEAHPEVDVKFSGYHRYFIAVEKEITQKKIDLPVVRGELNYCFRGCYSSAARIKYSYRQAEAQVGRAETMGTAIAAQLSRTAPSYISLWKDVLFNSFHDILPGSSTERALDEQVDWIGGIRQELRTAERNVLLALAQHVDTTVPKPATDMPSAVSFIVWNPHPNAYRGPLEIEAAMDYRPIFPYDKRGEEMPLELLDAKGRAVPFQVVRTENLFMQTLPWRKRVVFDAELLALGWSVFTFGWVEKPKPAKRPSTKSSVTAAYTIQNSRYKISARMGDAGIKILRDGRPLVGNKGMSIITVEDAFGPWGGHYDEPEAQDLSKIIHTWSITKIAVLEHGPLRASLWVRLNGGSSRCDLTLQLHHHRDAVDIQARVFFNETRARVKMVFPIGAKAEYEVPGATVVREPAGEVPGGQWVRVLDAEGNPVMGFASDALYNFDQKPRLFRATVVRSSRHALDVPDTETSVPADAPVIDSGEYKFRFLLNAGDVHLPRLAAELIQPVVTMPVPPTSGLLKRSGSVVSLSPDNLRLLALKPAEKGKGIVVRVQETKGKSTVANLTWLGRPMKLGRVKPHSISTFQLETGKVKTSAEIIPLIEF